MHPDVQVSLTVILETLGNAGDTRSQIQRARFSLVGFSSPAISLR
jgi:hypothetical protein